MSVAGETSILLRLFQSAMHDLDPSAARAMLRLKFDPADVKRVDKLSALARKGALSKAEERELDHYLAVNNLLILIHSKARQSLKKAPPAPGTS